MPGQRSITSFFSANSAKAPSTSPNSTKSPRLISGNTTTFPSPSVKSKSAKDKKKADVTSVADRDDHVEVEETCKGRRCTSDREDDSSLSSPVKRSKRKRAQVIESDDEDVGEENKALNDCNEHHNKNNENTTNCLVAEERKEEGTERHCEVEKVEKKTQAQSTKLAFKKAKIVETKSKKERETSLGDSANMKSSSNGDLKSPRDEKPKLASIFTKSKDAVGKVNAESLSGSNDTSGDNFGERLKKSRYHPINDACWSKGTSMPFMAFAETLAAIEETKGRLRMTEILANFFRSQMVLSPTSLLPSIYMCLNRLAPATEGLESGVGDFILQKALAQATGRSVKQIREQVTKLGDMGAVAEVAKATQRTMFKPAPLELESVFKRLKEIALMSGKAVVEQKVSKIQGLLVACRDKEAKYLVRSLAGKLRIGLAEQSLLQALAQACVMTPPPIGSQDEMSIIKFKDINSEGFKDSLEKEALKLKTAFCECPNYDLVVPVLLESGLDEVVSKCKLTPGLPLKPMLAHPTKGVEDVLSRFEGLKFTCEWKYDGERAQIHLLDSGEVKIFSRNQEDHTSKYPDVTSRLKSCFNTGKNVRSCVIDTEAVAFDTEKKRILPFQVLSTRKRKDANESNIKVQVCLFAFDLLFFNGEPLIRKSLRERRELMRECFVEVENEFTFAKARDADTTEAMQEALDEAIDDKCEGLMVKTLDMDASYEIARRSRNWLKLKKDYLESLGDTLDLVVIGGYHGKGKRTGNFGGFLLACYEPEVEVYQSICKIGTGFSDADLSAHGDFFKKIVIEKPKDYYRCDIASLKPDAWFDAVQVWEVRAADLSLSPVHKAAEGLVDDTKGISLRFPRFVRVREDKKPEDATDSAQVAEMYRAQMRENSKKRQGASSKVDDFDF